MRRPLLLLPQRPSLKHHAACVTWSDILSLMAGCRKSCILVTSFCCLCLIYQGNLTGSQSAGILSSLETGLRWCRCDNITIAPALLGQLEASTEPLERKLWPTMGGCDEPKVDLTAGQVQHPSSPPQNQGAGCACKAAHWLRQSLVLCASCGSTTAALVQLCSLQITGRNSFKPA